MECQGDNAPTPSTSVSDAPSPLYDSLRCVYTAQPSKISTIKGFLFTFIHSWRPQSDALAVNTNVTPNCNYFWYHFFRFVIIVIDC